MRTTTWRSFCLFLMALLGLIFSACIVSSGGSSPSKPTSLTDEERVSLFASANFDRLKEDMAAGQGEHLASLATLLGVPQAQQPEFFSFTKQNFPLLYPSEEVTSDDMVTSLTREMSSHPQFRPRAEKSS